MNATKAKTSPNVSPFLLAASLSLTPGIEKIRYTA
jgi:hypothetical protein